MKNTKLFKKRLELLSQIGEVQISDNGNYYVILFSNKFVHQIEYSPYSVTKNTLKLIGQTVTYRKKQERVLMLTKDNKLKYKNSSEKFFSSLSLKDLKTFFSKDEKVLKLFFYNKRCEWILNYPEHMDMLLMSYNLIKSFKSLKELTYFLGYKNKLKDINLLVNLIAGYNFSNKENLIKAQLYEITDSIRMIIQTESYHYYLSDKSIANIHKELVQITNKASLDSLPNNPIYPEFKSKVDEKLAKTLIPFKSLISHRDLTEEGLIQNHCIGSKAYFLDKHLFYSILYNDERYSLHCNESQILEFRGSQNKDVPKELLNVIQTVF